MAQYAIMRFAKQKGGAGALEAHHERTKDKYASNPDIDTARSKDNIHIIAPTKSYKQEADSRIQTAGCKTRKDSVQFIDTLITASPTFFKGKKPKDIEDFFKTAVEFLARKIGKDNIFSAVVHVDEKTPHLHLCFTPITQDGRLSAKDIIGNRTQLTKWQDDFYSHIVKNYPDLERGESASFTGRRHIPTRIFKQAVRLTKQAEKIQSTLDSINPFNAGKKRDEVVEQIRNFFPKMERFETQMKKYKREFERMEQERAELEKRAEAGEKVSIAKRLEDSKLQADYQNLRRFVDSLLDEIKEQMRLHQRSHNHFRQEEQSIE
ncbi:MAG: plasmid recombination protein [Oscillospiraceae bacterium]|nr:plasmid recombination protein [Oscillospiraceae bacterium]